MDTSFNSQPSTSHQQALQQNSGATFIQDDTVPKGGYRPLQQDRRTEQPYHSIVTTGQQPKMQPSAPTQQQYQIRPMGQRQFTGYIPHTFVGFTDAQKIALKYQIEILKMFKRKNYSISVSQLEAAAPSAGFLPSMPAPAQAMQYMAYVQQQGAMQQQRPPTQQQQQHGMRGMANNNVRNSRVQTDVVLRTEPPIGRHQEPLCSIVPSEASGPTVFPPPAPVQATAQFQLGCNLLGMIGYQRQVNMYTKRKRLSEELECDLPCAKKQRKTRILIKVRKLRLVELQKKVRRDVEQEQEDIMGMQERAYRKFVRDTTRSKMDMVRQAERHKAEKVAARAQEMKSKSRAISDYAATVKDLKSVRNKHIMRWHERQLRGLNKQRDMDDRSRRLDALQANDLQAYQELLQNHQTISSSGNGVGGNWEGAQYAELYRFLTETEEFIQSLASKIAHVKIAQEASEAANAAISEARELGLSEEEVQRLAQEAAQEAAVSSEHLRKLQSGAGDVQSRYYGIAHSVDERVIEQPRKLHGPNGAKLREYQMVGLQWMVSLYNNHLNGILADEMGLGKTVQVMALVAYLMEHKQNYGPHLIIVPNAVMVNWKAELTQWLPDARCVYYVGKKEDRSRLFQQEVQSLQFNVLVTTYEYIMRDVSKLAKVEWQYLIVDEAQRLKERQSKLARDLARFTCSRRLLLTGTPLQNNLRELWNLLNLLLPEVFNDKQAFNKWFAEVLADLQTGCWDDGDGDRDSTYMKSTSRNFQDERSQFLKEKRILVVNRLHQILEPFMLRRQVQDVESKLPQKISITIKVAMSKPQLHLYEWVRKTATIRLHPEDPRVHKFPDAQSPLHNRMMELRKACNHPMLCYDAMNPLRTGLVDTNIVRMCGKMYILDRLLVKLFISGHRVLLFSTMTSLLDILEVYLKWRKVSVQDSDSMLCQKFAQEKATNGPCMMAYRRIDGSTPLEDRESAIQQTRFKCIYVFVKYSCCWAWFEFIDG